MKLTPLSLTVGIAISMSAQDHAAIASPDSMKFELNAQDKSSLMYQTITGDKTRTIFATGVIDDNAPVRLLNLIRKNNIPAGSQVELDSPGGNLLAGIKLGQIIRSFGFNTDIARFDRATGHAASPGECFSACTLAFLGGRWRFITHGSEYGVHRFYFSKPAGTDSDVAQMISAAVVQYIRDMGADPELFSAMTVAGKENIALIPEKELKRLNVINDGQTPTVWSVESTNGLLYLKGQRDTAFGINKFLLACTSEGVDLTVVMSPLPNDPLPPTTAVSLVTDDKRYPLEDHIAKAPELNNGSVFTSFILPPDLVQAMQIAHKVGIEFQFVRDAPTFAGFLDMDFDDGANKMSGVLRGCIP
jgi:hypothetical protein